MRSGAFGTAAVTAAVLALPAPALAASQWEVSPTFAAGCDSGHRCHSLTDVKNAGPSDGDVVLVDPGTYSESPTFPVPLTLRGNKPGDATIRGTIAFSLPAGPASSTPVTVQRLIVLPTSGDALSITTNPATAGMWTVEIESTILSGTSTGAGLHVVTGAGTGTVSATGRHVTIADAGSADATNLVNNGVTAPSAAFVDSIVLGSTSAGTNVGGEASVADRSATATVPVRVVSASSLSRSADRTPPRVSITTPRPGQRLREGRTVPRFAGRVSDDSGVRRVELALFRRRGRGCLWFDGRRGFRSGSCSRPRWFRALVNDFT